MNKEKNIKIFKNLIKLLPILLLLLTCGYVIKSIIEAKSITDLLIEYLGHISILLLFVIFTILMLIIIYVLAILSKKKWIMTIVCIVVVISSFTMVYVSNTAVRINNSLNNIVDDETVKSIYLVSSSTSVYADNSLGSEEEKNADLEYNDTVIGALINTTSFEGNILPLEYQMENDKITKVVYYQSWVELVEGLNSGEVDIIGLPTNYESLFTLEEFQNVNTEELVIIDKFNKEVITSTQLQSEDPFSILVLAVDKTIYDDDINGLYDVVVLITFIPQTGEIVMNSIPRDTTLKSPCINDQYDKINHNGNPYLGEGTNCIVETVEQSFETEIDYSLVVGFTGMMEIVDYLDGIYIDNQYGDFWGQDENRYYGSVYVPGGYNLLDGQQALSYARNRSQGNISALGAFDRSQAHVTVIKAILDRMMDKNIFTDLPTFLDIIAENTYTDFPMNDLVALNQLAQKFLTQDELKIHSVVIDGVTGSYDSPLSSIPLSGFKPYVSSMEYMINTYNMIQDGEPFVSTPDFDLTSIIE